MKLGILSCIAVLLLSINPVQSVAQASSDTACIRYGLGLLDLLGMGQLPWSNIDSMCTIKPKKISFINYYGGGLHATGAYLSQSDSLFVFSLRAGCVTSECGGCYISLIRDTFKGFQPFPGNLSFETIHLSSFTDSFSVVFMKGIRPYIVTGCFTGYPGGWVQTKIDSLPSLSIAATRTVLSINREPGINGNVDKGLWITGTKGMVRYFPLPNSGTENIYDLPDTTKDVTCYGEGYIGTGDGSVYQLTGSPQPSFSLVKNGTGSRLTVISAAGAVGDSGVFYDNTYGSWEQYRLGSSNYKYFFINLQVEGARVRLYDESYNVHEFIYKNTPSFIGKTTPASILQNMKTPVPYAADTAWPVSIGIGDTEQNYDVPLVVIVSPGAGTDTLAGPSVAGRSSATAPSCLSCNAVQFGSTDFSFVLRPDSISLKNTLSRNEMHAGGCGSICAHWSDPFIRACAWAKGDTLRFSVGFDTVRFVNEGNTGIGAFHHPPLFFMPSVQCVNTGKTVTFRIKGVSSKKPVSLSLYDLTGRKIWSVPHITTETCCVPHVLARGMVIVVVRTGGTTVYQHAIPLSQ